MKYEYKIAWLDDAPEDLNAKIVKIRQILNEEFHVKPQGLEDILTSLDEFKEKVYKYDDNSFINYDLFIIDYNLSDSSGKTGIDVIKDLRRKNIYTDVLFYSGNMDNMRKDLQHAELDNVTYSDVDKTRFYKKFRTILNRQLMLGMKIPDIRGYLMDATSDFDFVTINYCLSMYSKISVEEQNKISEKIKKYVNNNIKRHDNSAEKLLKCIDNLELLSLAITSQDFLIKSDEKMKLLSYILRGIEHEEPDEFLENYRKNIISIRNKFAHARLLYGQNQNGHIKIAKNISDLKCSCDGTTSCDSLFTYSECKELRKNISDYYEFFNGLLDEIIS